MKSSIKIIAILILVRLSLTLAARDFETLTYYQNDTLKLELDLFLPDSTILDNAPLFIIVHGAVSQMVTGLI